MKAMIVPSGVITAPLRLTRDEARALKWEWIKRYAPLPYNAWPAPWPPPTRTTAYNAMTPQRDDNAGVAMRGERLYNPLSVSPVSVDTHARKAP